MSKKLKLIILIFSIFALFIGGAVYFAASKINPTEIKKIVLHETQKIFPNATVELDSIHIKWGLHFKISLTKFHLWTKDSNGHKVDMFSVEQFLAKVPLWAILANQGLIELQVANPLIHYAEEVDSNNWNHALGNSKKDLEQKNASTGNAIDEKPEGQNKEIPSFFDKNKINIKITDITLSYALKDKSNGKVNISKFLVKGLNFEGPTAFEIASNSKFKMADQSELSFNTIVIGELNVAELIKKGTLSSTIIIKNNEMKKSGLDWKFPEVTTNLNLSLSNNGQLNGQVLTTFEGQNKLSANFVLAKSIQVTDINVDINLKDIGNIIGLDRSIDLAKAKLTAKGKLKYSEDKKVDADLGFEISPGVIYNLDGISSATTIEGTYRNNHYSLNTKTDVFNGIVESKTSGILDLSQKFDLKKIDPISVKLMATGLKIQEKFIQDRLWNKKKIENSEADEQKKSETSNNQNLEKENKLDIAPSLPPVQVNLNWNNILIGQEAFSGEGKIITGGQTVTIADLNFKFSKGSGKLNQAIKMQSKQNDSIFDFTINNLNLSSFKAFLPPFIEQFSGTFSGKVNGNVTMYQTLNIPPRFDINIATNASKGEIKKLNISDFIKPLLANIPVLKDQAKEKELKIDGNFETLTLKGHFTPAEYNLAQFNFVGINKKVELQGQGSLFPIQGHRVHKTSSIDVSFTENGKIGEAILKNTGAKMLPMKLTGPGLDLKPDYSYTLSKITKGAIKTKGAEAVEKVLDKSIDKYVPEKAKEKVKGLLNGLFKK